MSYQILDWDTNFFGITVARINKKKLSKQELLNVLLKLKANNIRLVYYLSDHFVEKNIIKEFNGNLADHKTTFSIDFKLQDWSKDPLDYVVEPYSQSSPIKDMEDLAVQSGKYSRFSVDKNIPREKFLTLYTTWINRSLRKEIAEEVLIIRESNQVVGLITLGNKNGRGDIGLIAVDKKYRGKKYGEKLVRAAQLWFVKNGYNFGQVITQESNVPACNLYKKCGYTLKKVEYFYHFWL